MSFWLKAVDDVDLSKHCIYCFKGPRYPIRRESGSMVRVPAGHYYYMCAVTQPYVWEDNFHLAFEYEEGSMLTIDRKGIKVVLANAKEIPITDKYIDWSLPQAQDKRFSTCRNWQFANFVHEEYKKKQPSLF